ncbi:hypothetical protein CAOG_009643 [Capsaspora owczarzaki ATCC 30864]|uniref:Uncharacterized protein n=1 Tax=Capsaspora owczarzaki (strain ATCC 30864) TaxID=595528 RepID=A0A0D2VP80_CAPO3|nr:hypothetical protein CAOG_009643 [Capsaspora owczarzaki ATCC 30864]
MSLCVECASFKEPVALTMYIKLATGDGLKIRYQDTGARAVALLRQCKRCAQHQQQQ